MEERELSSIRESERHSLSLHCVPARDFSRFHPPSSTQLPGPGLAFSSLPGLQRVGHLGSPRLSLASLQPYVPRRAQPLQRWPRTVNVCLDLRQQGPQKPSDTRKAAPGAQAHPVICSRVIGTNPSSNFTPANREENKGRVAMLSPA